MYPKFLRAIPSGQKNKMKATAFVGLTVLNLGLVSYVCLRPAPTVKVAGKPEHPAVPVGSAASRGNVGSGGGMSYPVTHAGPLTTAGFHWRQIESEDYAIYIANLRRIGCPEATVRDIVVADVRSGFDSKRAAVHPAPTAEFWRRSYEAAPLAAAVTEQLIRLAREEQALLTHLLGGHWPLRMNEDSPATSVSDGLRLDGALAGKRDILLAWHRKADAQRAALLEGAAGRDLTAAEQAQLSAVDAASQAELTRLLTPAEREEFELRNSVTATSLRDRLVGFSVSEDEFRSLFRLEQSHQQSLARADEAQDPAAIDAELAAYAEARRKLLGDEREAWFRLAGDTTFQAIHEVGQQNSLPLEQISQAHALHRDTMNRIAELDARTELSQEQRQSFARQALQAHDQQMKALLGPTAFQAYAQTIARGELLGSL